MTMEQPGTPARVWRGFDRATLEREYDARGSVADFDAEYAQYVSESATARATLAHRADIPCDPEGPAMLDLYSAGPDTPVFLWIHGGYWRAGSRQDSAYVASGLVPAGISVAVLGYSLAPAVRLPEIVRQSRQAVAWLHRHGPEAGLRADRIHVGGSSAGGHLAAMMLAGGRAADWTGAMGLPADVIGAVLALSGLHDLEPLRHTVVNDWLDLDEATIADFSPLRHIAEGSAARLLLSVGGLETAEFRRQTAAYAEAARAKGVDTTVVEMPGHNHFDIARDLARPEGRLTRALAQAIHAIHPPIR